MYYDIQKWLDDPTDEIPLSEFKLQKPVKFIFKLTNEQYKIVEDALNQFGDSIIAKNKALKMVTQRALWRNPVIES